MTPKDRGVKGEEEKVVEGSDFKEDTFRSEKSEYYVKQLEQIRIMEQQKWDRMIEILKEIRTDGPSPIHKGEILDKLI
jgi:hypothetical protein